MNIELLDRIAKWLEAGAPHETAPGGIGFNMNVLHAAEEEGWSDGAQKDSCGTACCIAGAALQFTQTPLSDDPMKWSFEGRDYQTATKLLDLHPAQAEALFFPEEVEEWDDIRPQQAALTIRNLIATGKVDWSHAQETDE